jgi:pimeloyl-ACP methyl ester carboxylesterase
LTPTRTFVLVHGSWQGAWSWNQIRPRLEARGHQVVTPTLPGHDATDTDRSQITHDEYVDAVITALAGTGSEPVVLVGHSLGGAVISEVADRLPERVACLVYFAAFVLRDGEAIGDLLSPELAGALRQLATANPDRSMSMPWELWRSSFMQTADEATARSVYERLVPEPFRPAFEPVRLRRLASLDLPAAFINCRLDQTQPPGFWHPGMSSRLPGAPVIELDADHEALLTAPDHLADALCEAAARPAVGSRPVADSGSARRSPIG